jgi:peptide/nickel transport system permease protein
MRWLARQIGVAVLLAWAVASIILLAMQFAPDRHERPQQHDLHLSALARYFDDFGQLLGGDLGRSLQDGGTVAGKISLRLPRTLELIGFATLLAALIGIPGGLFAVIGRHETLDRIAAWSSAFALAVPAFVLAVLLAMYGAPAGDYVALSDDPLGHLTLLVLPAIAIALGLAATVFRVTRTAALHVTQRDFVRTARAKGLGLPRILLHHVLRNALMPVLTVFAGYLGTLLGATVLVEYVFNYPGLLGPLIEAVRAGDYPMVEGIVLAGSVLFVVLNLMFDLLNAALDPRVSAV